MDIKHNSIEMEIISAVSSLWQFGGFTFLHITSDLVELEKKHKVQNQENKEGRQSNTSCDLRVRQSNEEKNEIGLQKAEFQERVSSPT